MLPWQELAAASKFNTEKELGDTKSTHVSSVLTRFSHQQKYTEQNSDNWVDDIEIEVDPENDFEVEDPDKGLMESLTEHIILNAKQTKNIINTEIDMLILAINERRKELLLQVDREKEKKMNRLRNKRRKYARSYCKDLTMENMTQFGRCRSTDDLNLETGRDSRMIENLRPLQCGDLRFLFDHQMYDNMKDFGRIEDSLASGLHSEAVGLGLNYSFLGEEASFKIMTKNNMMDGVFTDEDKISVQIRGPNDETVTAMIKVKNNGMHIVTYTPTNIGHHKIHVYVNRFELLESPFSCETLSKENLAFGHDDPMVADLRNHVDDWVLNKEETSALLETSNQSGALIFGAKSFSQGRHGWKIKFTSACAGVNIAIGVSAKTRIVEIDTKHTCNFTLDSINTRQPTRRSRPQRKLSTFHRQTKTFYVILDMDDSSLTIVCYETEERQIINIPKEAKQLYPCVYMVHECTKNVCPRPLVAFS